MELLIIFILVAGVACRSSPKYSVIFYRGDTDGQGDSGPLEYFRGDKKGFSGLKPKISWLSPEYKIKENDQDYWREDKFRKSVRAEDQKSGDFLIKLKSKSSINDRFDGRVWRPRSVTPKPTPTPAPDPANLPLPQSAVAIGCTHAANWWIRAGIYDILTKGGPFTALSPFNKLWNDLGHPSKIRLLHDKKFREETIKSMIMIGKFRREDFYNEQLVPTLLKRYPIRVNVYKKGNVTEVTFNGAPMWRESASGIDLPTKNGLMQIMTVVPFRLLENIQQHISTQKSYSVFATMLKITGLDHLLKKKGPFTVFVPTDEAFNALDDSIKKRLIKDEDFMYDVAALHIVNGRTMFQAGLLPEQNFRTVLREYLTVKINSGQGSVEDSSGRKGDIILADLAPINGVIHTINKVMLPRDFKYIYG